MVKTVEKTIKDKIVPKARGRPRKDKKVEEKVKLPKETKKRRPVRPKKLEKSIKRELLDKKGSKRSRTRTEDACSLKNSNISSSLHSSP